METVDHSLRYGYRRLHRQDIHKIAYRNLFDRPSAWSGLLRCAVAAAESCSSAAGTKASPMPSASRTAQPIDRAAAGQSIAPWGRPVYRSHPSGSAASTTGTPSRTAANEPESLAAAGVSTAAVTTAAPSAVQRSHRDHRRAAGPAVRAAAMPTIVARRDAVITSNPNIVGLPAGAVRD